MKDIFSRLVRSVWLATILISLRIISVNVKKNIIYPAKTMLNFYDNMKYSHVLKTYGEHEAFFTGKNVIFFL